MKKTLVALAALAATGAFAQVTITGNLAMGYAVATNVANGGGDVSGLGVDTSEIDFAATEDLGGGVKAFFQCESSAPPDAGGGTFCSRNSGVGLQGKPYPVFKNFYGGGLGTVRAFEQGSLGVPDPTGAYIGGSKRINVNTELYFPVPGTGNDKSLRIFAFADTGNVWGTTQQVHLDDLRASAGFGLSWISPVGPLKLSWGTPLKVNGVPGNRSG